MRILRWMGEAWASPGTLAGLLLARVTGSRRLWHHARSTGYEARGRLLAAWFERSGMAAFTWGRVIVLRQGVGLAPRLYRHEYRHVQQQLVLGPLILPLYVVASAWAVLSGGHWHRDNVLERDARTAEGRPC